LSEQVLESCTAQVLVWFSKWCYVCSSHDDAHAQTSDS